MTHLSFGPLPRCYRRVGAIEYTRALYICRTAGTLYGSARFGLHQLADDARHTRPSGGRRRNDRRLGGQRSAG